MSNAVTPQLILATLLPHLRVAAGYAQEIQGRIVRQPTKPGAATPFAAALTDADLSIQTFVEVALLGTFPHLRFYGEEHQQTFNTKYFRAIELGPPGDYLLTLDPIDGTRFYQDGHPNYQIIVAILNADDYEAVLAISPAQGCYYYALRGQGAFCGQLEDDLEDCTPLVMTPPSQDTVLLGSRLSHLAPGLRSGFKVIDVGSDYSSTVAIPSVSGILTGELTGVVLSAGKWIDGAALAFLAQAAGCLVTTHEGEPLPPLHTVPDYQRPALIIAASPTVHQALLDCVQGQAT